MSEEEPRKQRERPEVLDALLGQADGLREEKEALKERIALERTEVAALETRLQSARLQAELKLGNAKWILGVLVVLGICGKIAYEALPTEVTLRFSSGVQGVEPEVTKLVKMTGLRVRRVGGSGTTISVLLDGDTSRDDEIKLRHFLDRLVKVQPPKKVPTFYLRGETDRPLRLDWSRNWVKALDGPKGSRLKTCVWAVPTRIASARPGFIEAEMLSEGIRTSNRRYQAMADRLDRDEGWYLYLRSKNFPTTFHKDEDSDRADRKCNWGVLLSADDPFLTLVFPDLAAGLRGYSFGKGLF